MTDLTNLERSLGISMTDTSLLVEALTHSSYVNENPNMVSNERLEFLGDAVLGLVLAEKLYRDYPDMDEGVLTHLRSWLVRRGTLFMLAREIHLGEYLLVGKGEENSGGRTKSSNLAGAMEAVIAAVFLDQGWAGARASVLHIFAAELVKMRHEQLALDYKSQIQELVQSRFKLTPAYRIVDESGPDHARHFTAEVYAGQDILARGSGRSKKLAEAEAARLALAQIPGALQPQNDLLELKQ
jgi:ribonuclease-3